MAQRLRSAADDGPVIVMDRPVTRRQRREALPPPTWGPPVAVDEIVDGELLTNREAMSAVIRADLFAARLIAFTQGAGVPLDESLPHIEFWRAFIESFTRAVVLWPWAFPDTAEREDDAEEWRMRTADDAAACGLSVVVPKLKRVRSVPVLPGCQGFMTDGSACDRLRRKGERFCPSHRALYLKQIREGRA